MGTNSIKILIVEDEAVIAERLYADLTDYGYEVMEPCLNAEEALKTLATELPDLLLLDVNLKSNIDGIQLAAIINQHYKLPFIFLTANTDDATIAKAAVVKPGGFLSKPVQLKTLIGTIQVVIYNHQSNKLQMVIDATAQYHFVKAGNNHKRIEWGEITYVESDKKYALIYEKGNPAPYALKVSLELLSQQLFAFGFIRIHKSFLINMDSVSSFTVTDVVVETKKIPIGDSYRSQFMQRLKTYQ